MRFRRLADKEFKAVEPEFIKFLASQGLDAPAWQKVKSDNPLQVEFMLDKFSVLFWESSTARITYLEKRSKTDRWVFKFEESKAHVLRWVIKESGAKPEISLGTKEFPQEARSREIFLLLEQGLLPCTEDRHEELEELFKLA